MGNKELYIKRFAEANIEYETDGNNIVVPGESRFICSYVIEGRCTVTVPPLNIKPGNLCPWAPNEWKRAQIECTSYKGKYPPEPAKQ